MRHETAQYDTIQNTNEREQLGPAPSSESGSAPRIRSFRQPIKGKGKRRGKMLEVGEQQRGITFILELIIGISILSTIQSTY